MTKQISDDSRSNASCVTKHGQKEMDKQNTHTQHILHAQTHTAYPSKEIWTELINVNVDDNEIKEKSAFTKR